MGFIHKQTHSRGVSRQAAATAAIEALEPRRLLAVLPGIAAPQPVPRPAFSTGGGFFVKDAQLYDANGYPFHIRGFNHTHWWGNTTNNFAAIDEFPKTRANAVRAVMGTGFGGSMTPAQRKTIVERYIANGIVPIVEDHMGTSSFDPASLSAIVD
ncbi:MAG: cellulase family glycosylhydrolase, partial [Tepidisphaeraceae bacterium]